MNLIEILRQEEYTGENRCGPCTLLNLAIAAGLSLIVSRTSKRGGIVVGGLSALCIYLRGYLIPGTPSLTKQYLPKSVLGWFGKEPTPDLDTGLGAESTPDVKSTDETPVETTTTEQEPNAELELTAEQYLLEQQVLEPCTDIDDLCLTSEFETAWLDEIDHTDVDTITAADAASLIGNDADDELEIVEYGDGRVVTLDDTQVGKWPSDAALIADLTAARLFADRDRHWDQYNPEQKGEILTSVRLFLETCPTSGGTISMSEETVES